MKEQCIDVIVTKREQQADDVIVVEFTSQSGEPLPVFNAGAHIDIYLADGLIRQYSLCSDPAQSQHFYRVGILKDPNSRGGSIAAHEILVVGAQIKISAPRNHFPLEGQAERTILIGGGIGITPMIAMAYELSKTGQDFDLYYCGRSKERSAFLQELASAEFSNRVHTHFTSEHQGERLNLANVIGDVSRDQHVYVCGPNGFMTWVIESAQALGYDDTQIHKEFFQVEVETSGQSFEVVCEVSGVTVQVGEQQTIAEALNAAGVKVKVSCEQGTCGTCLCDVVEGIPDHRDVYLTDEEKEDNDQMTLCCSRSLTPTLVLDI